MDSLVPATVQQYNQHAERLESAILASGESLDIKDLPTTHYFTENGMYCRALVITKGIVATGKCHRQPHFFMILSGDLSVRTNDGRVERLTPPYILACGAGVQRTVYAHEDTLAVTVHKHDSQDLDTLESDLVTRTYTEYLALSTAGQATGELK